MAESLKIMKLQSNTYIDLKDDLALADLIIDGQNLSDQVEVLIILNLIEEVEFHHN